MLSRIAVYSGAGKYLKTPYKASKRSKMPQNAVKCRKTPQFAAKHKMRLRSSPIRCKTPQNDAKIQVT